MKNAPEHSAAVWSETRRCHAEDCQKEFVVTSRLSRRRFCSPRCTHRAAIGATGDLKKDGK